MHFRKKVGVFMSYLIVAIFGAGLAIGYWFAVQKYLPPVLSAAKETPQPPPSPMAKEKAPQNNIYQSDSKKESPDVALRFIYPKSPALIIKNLSDSVARDIKWTVVLWNMDLPDRNDPLPIPIQVFDWLRAHSEGGPENLFNTPSVTPLLKPGNRLFGSASVDCPTCSRGRTYIVYIVWGQGGWFSEVENEKSGDLIVPKNFLRETREMYFKQLEALIPKNSRLLIGEHGLKDFRPSAP